MSRGNRIFKLGGCLIKSLFSLIIAVVCVALLWRLFSSGDPKSMSTISVNDKIYDAYNEDGELKMFRQSQNSITRTEKNYGYFSVTNSVFVPECNQIQIVFRYNNSTIRALAEDYSLAEVPSRETELYDVTLLLAIDLTPDVTEDNATNDPESVRFVRVHAASHTRDTKLMYNYYRYTFDIESSGENINELLESGLLLAVYTDVYYIGDLNYDQEPYGTLCLYDYLSDDIEVELKSRDKKAFKEYEKD